MSIQYLKTKTNASFVRPVGYVYPSGLAAGVLSVNYLVVAGGGGGGSAQTGVSMGGGGGAGGL